MFFKLCTSLIRNRNSNSAGRHFDELLNQNEIMAFNRHLVGYTVGFGEAIPSTACSTLEGLIILGILILLKS